MIRLKYHIINRYLYNMDTHNFMTMKDIVHRLDAGEKLFAIDQDGNDITSFILAKVTMKKERDKVREKLKTTIT